MYKTPAAQINYVSVEQNVWMDIIKGMVIHLRFEVFGLEGVTLKVTADFFSANGRSLKAVNSDYMNNDGSVALGMMFTPRIFGRL